MTGSSLVRRASLVGLLALVLSVIPLAIASAQEDLHVTDLDIEEAGNVAVAIRLSQYTFASADEALLGRDNLFADSLASGSLQGGGRPLLLTASEALDQRVVDELNRLGVTTVHILGGQEAISNDVEDELEAAGFTVGERFEGITRVETAVDIAEFVDGDTALLARSHASFSTEGASDDTQAFADSLAAGGWAADEGWPVLFTYPPGDDNPNTEPDESALGESLLESTRAHIEAAGYTRIIIVGGTEAVSEAVETELAGLVDTVDRVGGANRFETAVLIANERGFADSSEAELTIVADGQGGDAWVDGFTAAALAGLTPAPIVLDNSAADALPPETADFLVEEAAPAAAFAQDPGAEHTLNPHGREATGEVAVCTPGVIHCPEVGEEMGVPVVVEPVPGEVTVDPTTVESGGTVTISNLGDAEEVLVGGDCVDEETDETANVTEEGTLEVTITAGEGTCTLIVTVDGEATEFEITVTAPPGNEGVITFCGVGTFDFSNQTESVTVTFDGTDTFTIGGNPATAAAFSAACSVGDQVVVTDNPDGTQTIALTNVAPGAINSGTIGNINTTAAVTTLAIIDPVTGTVLNVVDYTPAGGALYSSDGATVNQAGFEADLDEGDTIVITPAQGATPATFALTNQTTTGEVSQIVGATVQLNGALGDDPWSLNDTHYPFLLAGTDTFTYSVDGAAATFAAFTGALSVGDTLSVSRNDGAWVFALTNAAPPVGSGDLTGPFVPAPPAPGGTITVIAADSTAPTSITYTAGAVFVVNGALATEAEFEAALSPGDDITHQAADAATGTVERITLVTDTLNNNCTPAAAGDPEVCSIPDSIDVVGDLFNVENPAGGVIYLAFDYTPAAPPLPLRYFVNGTEGTLTAFEVGLATCMAATANCSIEVVQTAVATEVRLDTDTTV